MLLAAMHLLPIKDLKDLRFFRSARFYRHAGPNGPEEVFFTGVIAGDRPPRYGNIKTGRVRLPGHRLHRDQEVSPTGKALRYETPSNN